MMRCHSKAAVGSVLCVAGIVALSSAPHQSFARPGECTPSTGPDIIVGELWGVTKWGTIDGITAYSFGATSCNIGDEVVPWYAQSNMHPVIAMNAFRYKGGRLEQIGMSWLKHGWGASTENLCCTCINPQNFEQLGVGCSDPYDPGLNGDQDGLNFGGGVIVAGLGPRSDVNPSTGEFPWPYTTIGQGGNAIYKRLQIHNSDLDPALNSGAIYFGECQYLSPHDTQAGNGNNNNSVARFLVQGFTGGGYNWTFAGPTLQLQNAVDHWKYIDPVVQVEVVDVPGDGRIIVGSRCTFFEGVWRYEYAVQNLTSHRSVGSFAVNVHDSIDVSNIGFHDVDYHSGEPYDGTDWPGATDDQELIWSTDPFEVNENANAIRWSTLYNFRFESTQAPTAGSATIGLFRPGSPQTIAVPVCGPQPAAPLLANDYCAQGPLILAGVHPFTTVGASTDGPLEESGCDFDGSSSLRRDVWFKYVAQCSGDIELELCDLDFDAGIAVYASCPGGTGQAIACSAGGCGKQSLSFNVAQGQLYRIRIGSADASTGSGTLHVSCDSNIPCPSDVTNDGSVDVSDSLAVIGAWGPCPAPPEQCAADIVTNGVVDVNDLLAVINSWGTCP